MLIIDEFKNQGIDYYSEPVPQSVIDFAKQKYPNSWENFLEKYKLLKCKIVVTDSRTNILSQRNNFLLNKGMV